MILVIASIITTLALIWLSSHDFSKKSTKPRNKITGRFIKRLPIEITYVWPRFRHVEERTLVRV